MRLEYQKKVNDNLSAPIKDQKFLKEYRNDQAVDKLRNNNFKKETDESEDTDDILLEDIGDENYSRYLKLSKASKKLAR